MSAYSVQLDATTIEALDAILLARNGVVIPADLVFYDDESIDYSDDLALTDEDLASGKIIWLVNTELSLDEKIRNWVKSEKINLNELSSRLITEFYRHSVGS